MKKIFVLLALLSAFALKGNAQSSIPYTFPLIAGDTLVNADTVTKVLPVTDGYASVGIQVNLKKISGTVASKAYLYRSIDGSAYVLVDSSAYNAVPTGTMFTGSTTHVAAFNLVAPSGAKYLVNALSSGTVSAQVRVYATLRRYPPR